MKAWQFTGTHRPLVLNDIPEPAAGTDEVLIDIKAAGLCHSDVSVLEVDDFPLPAKAHLPVTLGHEIAGVISGVGADVRGWQPGDRVAIGNIPPLIPGIFRDGGYAARVTSRAEYLLRIPDSVSFAQAAVGTDAGMTARGGMIGASRPAGATRSGSSASAASARSARGWRSWPGARCTSPSPSGTSGRWRRNSVPSGP